MIIRIPTIGIAAGLLLANNPLAFAASPSDLPLDTPVSQILNLASSALSSGSSQDALAYYDIAVARDPSNYLTLFKRGATHLSLGRAAQASSDFDKVLALKPDFEGALTQRAKIRARSADWNGAREDYKAAGGSKDTELAALDEAEGAATLARTAETKKDWEACVSQAGAAIVVAAASAELRQLRARCRLERGEVAEAATDLQHVLQINPSLTEPALRISALMFYSMGESDKGLEAVKKCLHSDPDQKDCVRLFKREKRLDKELKKAKALYEKRTFTGAVKALVGVGSEEPGLVQQAKDDIKELRELGFIHTKAPDELVTKLLEMACDSYIEMNNHKRGAPHCQELLKRSPNSLPGLIQRAQTELDADDFEGALRTLNTASEEHGQTKRLNDMTQKAQTLLKRSKTKDYYKVLGLDREASSKEIKRAYLRMSKENHPDKVPGGDAERRKAAEKKMSAINEAYEVLKDPELKARFDAGDDPNDPEAQARGHGGPFQGSPFGHQQFVFRSGGGFPGGGFPGGFPGGGGGGGFEQMFGGGGGFQFGF